MSVLERICRDKAAHVAAMKAQVPAGEQERRAAKAPPPRGFATVLAAAGKRGYGLIAEIKRASPSKGLIRADFDPPALARAYAAGGAACLSVLTDMPHFQGEDRYLGEARGATMLPALRKDFMIDPYQILESRALGADGVLVIMAAVDDALARDLVALAHDLGMDALVEVHDAAELDRALKLPARLIGINNRDLKTLKVDLATAEGLAPKVPPDRVVVAESGLETPADLQRLAAIGVRSFLVGESLMRQADVERATRALLNQETAEAARA
jgi:indole-3-glycerol phosphate synthase